MKLSETTERGVDVFIFVFGNISVIYTFTLLALLAYYCILLLFALHICIACFFLSLLFFFREAPVVSAARATQAHQALTVEVLGSARRVTRNDKMRSELKRVAELHKFHKSSKFE